MAYTALSAIVVALWALLAALLPRALRRVPRMIAAPAGGAAPQVSIVIPARNEEQLLPRCLAGVAAAAQAPARLEVVVVDDGSTDATAQVAAAAGARVLPSAARPAGWAGKCWAAWQGAQATSAEWLAFLDADVTLAPGAIPAAVAAAEAASADLLAPLLRAACATRAEAVVQPVMLFLMMWHLNVERANDPRDPVAAAPGGFLLFRRASYVALGGHEAVRGEVVEDLRLAQRVKQQGQRLWLCAAPEFVVSSRALRPLDLWRGWCRVVSGLPSRGLRLGGAVGVLVLFVYPVAVAWVSAFALALAVLHVALTWNVRVRLRAAYGIDDSLALLQPLGALFAAAVLVRSALASGRPGAQVHWRGRDYQA
jgi:cellulose synthase/poly-beta-1,6-N-acetylglucosamine synthase-like glycosyltransferase